MLRSLLAPGVVVLMIGALVGCTNSDKTAEAAKSPPLTNGAGAAPSSEGGQHQYRAVCIEKAEHGGNEYVLSKWLDSREKADELGKYHGDFKYKGHRWRIDERAKP
ncbi:MAG: hypothetical protein ACREOO_17950 [bacterium]